MTTRVVHCKREKYTVYIGRANPRNGLAASKWGNPFRLEREADREKVLQLYREWIMKNPQLLADLHELRGQVLGCWCHPKRCHGDLLAELAELAELADGPVGEKQAI